MLNLGLIEDTLPSMYNPRFNIAPGTDCPIVHADHHRRTMTPAHWGYVPFFIQELDQGPRPINARSESASTNGMFRHALHRKRGLIPADGFYEWRGRSGHKKQPHLITLADEQTMTLGGLWDVWTEPGGSELWSFCILTTKANAIMQPIHDRMPVIIAESDRDRWLDIDVGAREVESMLRPYPSDEMLTREVSTYVNHVTHQGPRCVEPADRGLFQ